MSTISYDDAGEDLRRIMISGRIDSSGTRSIASQLVELAVGPKKAVVVDLTDVEYLASLGLGALISSAKAVMANGGKIALVVAKGSLVMMSLHATGTDQLIPIYETLPEAESATRA